MKARDYLEHNYFPWILNLDPKDTINHFLNGKEEFLCETYNHITREFKAIEFYELYMFRIQTNHFMTPHGMVEAIICKTPPVRNPKDANYIIIVHNKDLLLYYTIDFVMDVTYQVRRYQNRNQTVIATISNEYNEMINVIQTDLLTL